MAVIGLQGPALGYAVSSLVEFTLNLHRGDNREAAVPQDFTHQSVKLA
jgi:hypothetical protein